MKRTVNILFKVDWVTISIYLLLVLIGWISIYAAVYDDEYSSIINFSQRYGKQLVFIFAALVMALFVTLIDNRFYFFFSWFIYGGIVLLLLLVLFIGVERNGARSWFEFGAIGLQPSEFAKFATALAVARFLHPQSADLTRLRTLLPIAAVIAAPALLITIQPDMGSAVVFASFFFVLFREGLSPYIFVTGILMIVLFFITLLFEDIYIAASFTLLAFLLIWLSTRRFLLCLAGLGIVLSFSAIGWLIRNSVFPTLSPDLIIVVSLILSGAAFA